MTPAGPSTLPRRIGLLAGPLAGLAAALALPTLSLGGRATAGLAAWMAVWWMTEAVSLYATALLPLGILPLFGAGSAREAAAPYGSEMIFLFLGGFLIALSMQRSGLDRRVAFGVVRLMGNRASTLVLGLMSVTAFLSFWVSNTATMITMYPIALSVLTLARAEPGVEAGRLRNLAHALLLGVAYAASIGGLGTLVGTPPNLFFASYLRDSLGREVGFFEWMRVSVPLVLVFLPAAWWLLLRFFPLRGFRIEGARRMAEQRLLEMGPLSRDEKSTGIVFLMAALSWVFRPLLMQASVGGLHPFSGLTDSGIAILAAVALFALPGRSGRVMNWDEARKLPFGILLLFGGGLSLAAALERNGVAGILGAQLAALQGFPLWAFLFCAVLGTIFLGELLSNTAMSAMLLPLAAAVALGAGWKVLLVLMPITWAASCGFMLPVATPPNAIAYGSGEIEGPAMLRAGFWINLLGAALILAFGLLVLPRASG